MRQPKLTHKKRKLRLSPNKFQGIARFTIYNRPDGIRIFIKFANLLLIYGKIRYSIKKYPCNLLMKLVWREYYNTYYFIYLCFLSI